MATTGSTSLVPQTQTGRNIPPTPSIPSQFVRFKQLPAEIRLFIWSFAISEHHAQTVFVEPKWFMSIHDWSRIRSSHIPSVLYVCHESRHLALKSYKLSFSEQLNHPVYFDETKDILAFKNRDVCRAFCLRERPAPVIPVAVPNVRYLLITAPYFEWFAPWELIRQAATFTNIETIFIEKPQWARSRRRNFGFDAEDDFLGDWQIEWRMWQTIWGNSAEVMAKGGKIPSGPKLVFLSPTESGEKFEIEATSSQLR